MRPKDVTDLHIFGGSDDLIELSGAVSDELDARYGGPTVVRVLATTQAAQAPVVVLLKVEYDPDGSAEWRISELTDTGLVTITPAPGETHEITRDEHDCPSYSDRATVRGGFYAAVHEDGLS